MDQFTFEILHFPGKKLNTADTLSRVPLPSIANNRHPEELAELMVMASIDHLPASNEHLETNCQAQYSDATCSTLMNYCLRVCPTSTLWPGVQTILESIQARGELTLGEDHLLYSGHMVVPKTMQAEKLQKLHQGCQGIQHCRFRTITSEWWPRISRSIDNFVSRCSQCCQDTQPARKLLMTSPLPDYPW